MKLALSITVLLSALSTISGCVSNNPYPVANHQNYSAPKFVLVQKNGRTYRLPVAQVNPAYQNRSRPIPARTVQPKKNYRQAKHQLAKLHQHNKNRHSHPLPNNNQIGHRHSNGQAGRYITQAKRPVTHTPRANKPQHNYTKPQQTKRAYTPKPKQVYRAQPSQRYVAPTAKKQTQPIRKVIRPTARQNFNCAETACSAISSCTEAVHKLQQCGHVKRDANRNGVPCEKICGKTMSTMNRMLQQGL